MAFCLILLLTVALPSFAATPDLIGNYSSTKVNSGENFASLIFGLFMGIMLTASAYLFFIWIVMRDRGQVFLLALLLGLAANIASTNDLLMSQAGFTSTSARNLLANYSLILSCIFSAFFTYYFLEIEINLPVFRYPLYLLSAFLFILLFWSFLNQNMVHFILPTLGTLTIAVVLIAGIFSLHLGVSGSLTHIIAFVFFLVGIAAGSLYELGFIISTEHSHNATYVAYSLAALMFAIVTASQFAARQEEKEKALAISNERFALATRGTNEGLFDWNIRTGEVFFSDQFKKTIGLRLENTTLGLKMWMRLMMPSDRRIVREALRRFRNNAESSTINIEYRIMQANDTRRWLYSKAVAMRDPVTKKIVRLVGSTSDITARKQNEVALRASEARFRSITEAHPVPVMIVGLRHGMILYASPGAEQLLGVPQNRLLHESFGRYLTDDTARIEIMDAMNHGKEINLKEIQLTHPMHGQIDAALSARRISYQNEEAMVTGLYDLTERKEAEAQIVRQQEALQQSEKMAALGGLLAGVAHELNNPLSVVVGQATLLMEGTQEPKVVQRAEKIFKAADRCARIVKSFLALARRKPPERKSLALNGVINGALELLGYQIRTSSIDVVMELENDLPEITGDGDQLTQVITNLVLNAAQAMEGWEGQRRLTIRTTHDDAHHVIISIADTGPGVPAEIRSRIFEPFFTTKGHKGGTGVGLSLCLNIVASHGGELQLENAETGGAIFTILLPMRETTQIEPGASPAQAEVQLPRGLKILLVDDEVEIAQTLADLLEPEGHQIDIAANGAIALEKLHKNTCDIIVSDLRMPVMDGPGLYDALARELPSYLNRIIYVTGDTLSSHVQTFLQQHPVPVVEKPYRLNDVRRAIATMLKENATRDLQKSGTT